MDTLTPEIIQYISEYLNIRDTVCLMFSSTFLERCLYIHSVWEYQLSEFVEEIPELDLEDLFQTVLLYYKKYHSEKLKYTYIANHGKIHEQIKTVELAEDVKIRKIMYSNCIAYVTTPEGNVLVDPREHALRIMRQYPGGHLTIADMDILSRLNITWLHDFPVDLEASAAPYKRIMDDMQGIVTNKREPTKIQVQHAHDTYRYYIAAYINRHSHWNNKDYVITLDRNY